MGIDIGKIGSALGALGGGLDLQELQKLGAGALSGGLDLQTIQQKIQEDPKTIQTLAKALGSMKAPDAQTLGSVRDAVAAVTAQAPAEQVRDELREISDAGKKDLGGFWGKLQPYLGDADKLAALLPLLTQYAPKAQELLQKLLGQGLLGGGKTSGQ